jgi:hypothetical protein
MCSWWCTQAIRDDTRTELYGLWNICGVRPIIQRFTRVYKFCHDQLLEVLPLTWSRLDLEWLPSIERRNQNAGQYIL